MKKLIIGSLVTGLILFVWQFVSFSVLDLHGSQMDYTPNQDAILEVLEANLEEGEYFIPRASRDLPEAEQQALMNDRVGKPWALVSYRNSLDMSMGSNMIRALIINILSGLMLCWVLMQFSNLNFKNAIMACLAVGLIGYLTINYLDQIWFEGNSIPDLIDAIVPWAIIGGWTGWYLPEKES